MRRGRDVRRAQHMQLQAQLAGDEARHILLAGGIVTDKLHQRRRACALLQRLGHRFGDACMAGGHCRRRRMDAQQWMQTVVEVVHTDEVVQHALVDAQAAAGQRRLVH